jgi:hypothetical protein
MSGRCAIAMRLKHQCISVSAAAPTPRRNDRRKNSFVYEQMCECSACQDEAEHMCKRMLNCCDLGCYRSSVVRSAFARGLVRQMTNSEQGKGKQGPVGEDGITQQEALSRYMQVTVMKGGQIDRLSNSRTAAATL